VEIYPWQQAIWTQLQARLVQGPRALLLHGPKGIGKLDLARRVARLLLCQKATHAGGCGNCEACSWFDKGIHPDYFQLRPESEAGASPTDETQESATTIKERKLSEQIPIAAVRDLNRRLALHAHQAGARVIVIEPAENMHPSAANALLKTLEEPPTGVSFILISHQPNRLMKTILSRCEKVRITLPDATASAAWLKSQSVADPQTALALAGGAPLEALQALTDDLRKARQTLLEALSRPNTINILQLSSQLEPYPLRQVLNWMTRWCYDLLALRLTGAARYHVDFAKVAAPLAHACGPLALSDLYRDCVDDSRLADHPLNARLYLESIFSRYLNTLKQ
jgi:DNA polymerase III subunit delta'